MMDIEHFSIARVVFLLAVICFFVFVFLIGRRSRWLAAVVFLGTIVSMLFLRAGTLVVRPVESVTLGGHSSQSIVVLVTDEQQPVAGRQERDEQLPVAWRPEAAERFIRDRYTSLDAAAQDFARHVEPLVYQVLREDPSDDASPAEIKVYSELFSEDGHLVPTMVDSLQKAFPEIDVSHDPVRMSRNDADSIADDHIYIEVKKLISDPTEAPWDRTQLVVTGSFETNVYGRDGHAKTNLRFVEKPWVLDFEKFSKSLPGRKHLLILSPEFANDQRSAEKQSEKLAVDVLKPIVRTNAEALPIARPRFDMSDELPDAIRDGMFVCDQFAQRLQTRNGSVWRHAMLVDLKDVKPFMTVALAKHRTMKKAAIEVKQVTYKRLSFRFGGLIALLASVCGIYWVLDTMTKGYFAGRVGVIVTVFGLVGLMLIWLMAG